MSTTTGTEDLVAEKWLRDTLGADTQITDAAPGGLWDGPARDGTRYPIVRWDLQSAVEMGTHNGETVWLNMLWLIRGVADGASMVPLQQIANRIYENLHGSKEITVDGGIIRWCLREQGFNQKTVEAGREKRYLGGIYRIVVQAS